MKTEQSIYIRILLWAYDKQIDGFSEKELFEEFGFNEEMDLSKWYLKVFRNGTNDNTPMIDHFVNRDDVAYWCLTEKGMSAAIGYLDLKEAREGGKRAMFIAILSLVLATVVGIFQIVIQAVQNCG